MRKILFNGLVVISLLGLVGCQGNQPKVDAHKKAANHTRGKGKFKHLKIGMGEKQVTDMIGRPTDISRYITGKSFIPYYMGPDSHRVVYYYRHAGRLVFNGGGPFKSGGQLIEIINDRSEDGYR